MFRFILIAAFFSQISSLAFSQQLLTESEAISKALGNNKSIQASSLQIKAQEQLLKSAFNLPNPEFYWESPSGSFYTGSITQSIEFPSVYTNQRRLQKQQIGIAQKEKLLSENEIKYRAKLLYMEAQYADSLTKQLYIQDTLYEKIKLAAIRQFQAGQIDYLQQTFAETQFGEVHNEYQQSIVRAKGLKNQLQWFTGIKEAFVLLPFDFQNDQLAIAQTHDSTLLTLHPELQLMQQKQMLAQQNISLQKSKALPGLAFGYFNQGDRDTKWYNRFRFGVTLPLWYGQYKANINAAKTEQQVVESQKESVLQELSLQAINAKSDLQSSLQSVQYYKQTGLPKAKEVLTTSHRFFVSGEIDYISLLRNSNEAYLIFQKNLQAILNYKRSLINYQYLTGQL